VISEASIKFCNNLLGMISEASIKFCNNLASIISEASIKFSNKLFLLSVYKQCKNNTVT